MNQFNPNLAEGMRRAGITLLPSHTFIVAEDNLAVPVMFLPMLPSTLDPHVIEHATAYERLLYSLRKVQIVKLDSEENGDGDPFCMVCVLVGNAESFRVPTKKLALKQLWSAVRRSSGRLAVVPYDPERSVQVVETQVSILQVEWINFDLNTEEF